MHVPRRGSRLTVEDAAGSPIPIGRNDSLLLDNVNFYASSSARELSALRIDAVERTMPLYESAFVPATTRWAA